VKSIFKKIEKQLLPRRGQKLRVFEPADLSFLKHTRRSTSLESQKRKAKSSKIATAISQNLDLRHHGFGNVSYFYQKIEPSSFL